MLDLRGTFAIAEAQPGVVGNGEQGHVLQGNRGPKAIGGGGGQGTYKIKILIFGSAS